MRIAVIGPLEVQTDDAAPVAVPGAKERLLLAVLVAGAPGLVSTERLTECLWDGSPPVSARKSLQAHLVRLRSSLEPDRPKGSTGRYVVRTGVGYALALDRRSIDALHVSDLAARGHALLASGNAAQAAHELDAAVGMWRGEPYADWPDAVFAEAERGRLCQIRAGAVAGLLDAQLQLGRHAEVLPELERLVAEDPLREDWWRLLMLALYRGGRQADALAAGRRARVLLTEELGADPGPALRDMETAILTQDRRLELPVGRAPPQPVAGRPPGDRGPCPYKGLATYQVADAALFHGRQRLVTGLVARLVDRSLLVVSGSSGAGKSSAVRAGLLPALARGALPDSETWRPVVVTPGQRPVDVLASVTGDPAPAAPVVLVIDQFEELWSPGVDPAERAAFLDTVLARLDDGVVVRCIAVVRGDHVGRLAEHAAFTERLDATIVLVPALTDPELRQVVREPARTVGLSVEPELLDAVVADVHGEVDALPLLSTALVGTWERRRGDRLVLAGYLGAGGVAGAMTRSAEAAYASLDDAGREQAHHLLVRLADSGEGGALVRRPVPLSELDLDSDTASARRAVVEAFVSRRLLAVHADRVEVAHEALLTGWPRLVRWLEDDAAGRAVRRHLAPTAREWEDGGRPDDELYRGARLAAALDWAAGADGDLTEVEAAFLETSRRHADAELMAARSRAEREVAARRRTRRLAQGLTVVLVLALVAAGLAGGFQRSAARRAADAAAASVVADANRLAVLSAAAGRLDTSLLLAAEAVRLADDPDTRDGLLAALVDHDRLLQAVPFPGSVIGGVLSDRGQTLFMDVGGQIATWSVGSAAAPDIAPVPAAWLEWTVAAGSPVDDVMAVAGLGEGRPWLRLRFADGSERPLLAGAEVGGTPLGAAWSPDGTSIRLLLAVHGPTSRSTSWRVVAVDPVDGTRQDTGIGGTVPGRMEELKGDVSDDGRTAVLWSPDAATLIGLTGGSQAALPTPDRTRADPPFRALPTGVAALWDDGGVTLYDRQGAALQDLDAHPAAVRDVAVASVGDWAVTVGDGGTVVRWEVDRSSGLWSRPTPIPGHHRDVRLALVDPAGQQLLTVGRDDVVLRWDMSADGGRGAPFPAIPGRWVANRPELVEPGLLVAPTLPVSPMEESSPPVDRPALGVAATFLDPDSGRVVAEVPLGDTVPGTLSWASVSVSPDRTMVAVTWGLGTTVLDTHSREVVAEVTLPPDDESGAVVDGRPLPATPVWTSAWTPDGTRLLLGAAGRLPGGLGGDLAVVDTTTWQVDRRLHIGVTPQRIEPSPDGRSIAVASSGTPEVVVLDASTLTVRHTVPLATNDRLLDLAFSPDGRLLAGVGDQGALHVIDAGSWQVRGDPVDAHEGGGLQVQWLADGHTVATTGLDGRVVLFDVDRGLASARPAVRVQGSADHVYLVPGATDELVVLAGDRPGRRFSLESAVWLREACAIVGRDLTTAEWDRYLPGRPHRPTCTDLS